MIKKKLVAALAATAAFGLIGASAANAVTVNGVEWSITSDWGVDMAEGGAVEAYGFDDFYLSVAPVDGDMRSLECATFASEVTDGVGNVTVACDEPIPDTDVDPTVTRTNLNWSGDVKVFSTGGDIAGRIARITYNLTNDTEADITTDLEMYYNNEECSNDGAAGTTGTSDGDTGAEITDIWSTCNNDNSGLEGIVWGNNVFSDIDFDGDAPNSYGYIYLNKNDFVVPACSTRTLVLFAYSTGALDHGAGAGSTDSAFNDYIGESFDTSTLESSLLMDGIDSADNWTGMETPAGSGCGGSNNGGSLAATGSNPSLAIYALGLLAAGFVAVRRAASAK